MGKNKRVCMICGENYEFCSHCNDYDTSQSWKYLFHDEKCADIAHIWYACRGGEISKEEAKKRMSVIKPNIDNVLKHTSAAANEIKEIFGINERKAEDVVAEEVQENIPDKVEGVVDNADHNVIEGKETKPYHKNKNKNYKNNIKG